MSVLTKKGGVRKKVFENTFPETFSVRMVKESVGDGQPGQDQKVPGMSCSDEEEELGWYPLWLVTIGIRT